jgi:putative acid phosphatase of HAD superfamily subfamily IIIB
MTTNPKTRVAAMAAVATVLITGGLGAAGSAAAQTVPSKSTWLAAVSSAMKGGTAYLDGQKDAAAKPAIVLDIDNTAVESYYQPFVATPPVLAFEQRAVKDGYQVLFATGRSADTGGTLRQLTAAGYHVDQLCFRDPTASSVQASKTACRAKWTAAGYGIIANVGNHTSDLAGGNSGKQYLLPNYGFLD